MGWSFQPEKLRFLSICAAVMLLLPMTAVLVRGNNSAPEVSENSGDTSVYRVYDIRADTVISVPVREYLIGAVAAEMPASYEPEALKAQVIASHTYAERIRMQNLASTDDTLHGADFSNDSTQYQAYLTDEELHALWGNDFARNYAKITDAVDAVGDLILCYDGEPIVAAFHAVSAGQTFSAGWVWGAELPYLVSVDSEFDKKSAQYESVTEVTADTLRKAIEKALPDVTLPDNESEWIVKSGTAVTIGNVTVTCVQLREVLSLPSPCLQWAYDSARETFIFTTYGCGHNVGMSQFGANEMARTGSTCEAILAHYYPAASLRNT